MNLCYIKGKIIPAEEAVVSAQDIGMLRGFGVYDGVTVVNGKGVYLQDHIIRFKESAAGLGLQVPETDQQIENIYAQLAGQMNVQRFNTRMILTGGSIVDGLSFDSSKPTFYILAESFTPLPDELYTQGGSLITHEFQRQFAQFKTINYITAVLTNKKKVQAGAVEVLFTNSGKILECATSNIFVVKEGVVMTPDAGILRGITRKKVIELLSKECTVKEAPVAIEDMLSADEIFITSSFKDIVPIVVVDGHKLFNEPGPITKKVIERYVTAAGLR